MKKQHQRILSHLRRGCRLETYEGICQVTDPQQLPHRQRVMLVSDEDLAEMVNLGLLVPDERHVLLPAKRDAPNDAERRREVSVPLFSVGIWDSDFQAYMLHPGTSVRAINITKWELRRVLKELREFGYPCHRVRFPDGGRDSDPAVLVERTDGQPAVEILRRWAREDYWPVPVETAKSICTDYHKSWCVILSADPVFDKLHTTTYGRDPAEKVLAAKAGDIITEAITGTLTERLVFQDFRDDLEAACYRSAIELLKELATLRGVIPLNLRAKATVVVKHAEQLRTRPTPSPAHP